MSKIYIDIRGNISPNVALEAVRQVVANGKVSTGEKGKKYYCWATEFETPEGDVIVYTRQYRKNDCFMVYKQKQ